MICLDKTGEITKVAADRNVVMKTTSVPARDLRLLDHRANSPACILIRERALVLNLESVRGILTADLVMVMPPHGMDFSEMEAVKKIPFLQKLLFSILPRLPLLPSPAPD